MKTVLHITSDDPISLVSREPCHGQPDRLEGQNQLAEIEAGFLGRRNPPSPPVAEDP